MSQERLLKVLLSPIISEKASVMADQNNQIAFRVAPDANKSDIRQAVEMLFDVKVDSVKVLNQKGKTKRFGQTVGKRNNIKKAYVRLAEGQDIDFASM